MLSRAYSFAGLKANLGTFSARGQPIRSPLEFSGRYQSGDGPEIVLDRANETAVEFRNQRRQIIIALLR
jgi:hypothetical protein